MSSVMLYSPNIPLDGQMVDPCDPCWMLLAFDNSISWLLPLLNTSAPVQGPTELTIANNWPSLFTEPLLMTLQDAGIVNETWWSGIGAQGELRQNCANWTVTESCLRGQVGRHDRVSQAWFVCSAPSTDAVAKDCGRAGRVWGKASRDLRLRVINPPLPISWLGRQRRVGVPRANRVGRGQRTCRPSV